MLWRPCSGETANELAAIDQRNEEHRSHAFACDKLGLTDRVDLIGSDIALCGGSP